MSARSAFAAATRANFLASRRSPFLPLLALALGLALIVVAFPRLMAAIYAAPTSAVALKLDREPATVTPAELLAARRALQLALAWEDDGVLAVRLARVDLVLAAREFRAGGDPLAFVDDTIEAARRGLTAAPAQARGWLLLAEATLARTSDPGAIVPFLLQSIAASPHDVWLAPNRAELGVRAWPWLDAKARAAVAEQIRLTSMRWPDSTVEIARRAGDPGPVREALASQPAVLRQFDVRYLQQR